MLDAEVERVEEHNPDLNAIVYPFYDEARRTIAAGLPQGPFCGVPCLLKDLSTSYSGQPMSSGSRLFAEFVADHDNALVARYKEAGLLIFARTTTPEFGSQAQRSPDCTGTRAIPGTCREHPAAPTAVRRRP